MSGSNEYTLYDFLGDIGNLDKLVDDDVSRLVHRLSLEVDEVTIAAASLGSSVEIIERLHKEKIFPDLLPEDQKDRLQNYLGADSEDLSSTVKISKNQAATFLGLPAAYKEKSEALPEESNPIYGLFPHQRRALKAITDGLSYGHDRILLHMPTGSGKTRTSINLVCDVLRRNESGAVLWVASTRELLEQAVREFHRAWSILGNREVPIISAWGGSDWSVESISDGFLAASPQTLHGIKKTEGIEVLGELGVNLQLIIFDEAHQAIARTYRAVVERLCLSGDPVTPVIGLTATPGRTFGGAEADDELASFFSHKKVMLDTSAEGGPENPVEYLIQHGYLANAEFELLGEIGDQVDSEITYDVEEEVDLGLAIDEYLEIVAKAVIQLVQEGHKRIIVFAASVDLSKKLATILRCAQINASAVHGGTENGVRQMLIREFRSQTRDPKILVNFGVLTTGFDAPETSAAVIARPTRSLVLYSQMAGRAIRGPRAGGNKNAKVITVVDPSNPAFGSIAQAFSHWNQYWENLE